ncbi:hypothetical protein [Ruminococcus sp.]|uniref:hypothetical protein n=1 Tax=Ruminococcus sp. TaxID=41978 RepID=UPI0025FB867A|nr:hypothetical protein [Ruminococcus sp.]MBR1432659.1 hypothetical protein [Ruminococcus sp.]
MSRKPLVNLNEINSTYSSNPTYNMLLSGNMVPVKRRVIDAALSKRNVPVLVINLDRTSPYISSCNYNYSINDGSTGYDMFSAMNIRDACIYLQNAAFEKSYCDEQTVQIIKYLRLIGKLNQYLGLTLPTIRDINAYYYKPDVIGKAITEMYEMGTITADELEHLNVSLVRGIKGQLIIDNILTSTDFNLNFDDGSRFSISNMGSGETAYIDLSMRHNTYTEKKTRSDILYSIEECTTPMMIVLNLGKADYGLVEDFITTATSKPNCRFIAIVDDVFAQVQNYDTIRRKFSLNLFGQHTGDSCRKMESCFHEIYKQEKHYARSVDSRLLADRFIDILFHTNHTDTTTTIPVKRSIIEQHDIANLSERAFIMLNNTESTNYFSLYSI